MFILWKPRGVWGPFHGWRVLCFGVGGGALGVSAAVASLAAAASAWARALRALASSLSRQQFLYFFPEPQWHGSLRPGMRGGSGTVGLLTRTLLRLRRTHARRLTARRGRRNLRLCTEKGRVPVAEPKVGDKAPDCTL